MAVNSAFHTNNVAALATEQNLYKNLVAEVIQIYGHDVHYLDRTLVAEDTTFGEDTLSKFRNSAKIEMYVENAGGGDRRKGAANMYALKKQLENRGTA